MHQSSDYELFIFDCDGVILDSNKLKIEAMNNALCKYFDGNEKITQCIDYFKNNFGTSRFHHISVFVNDIFKLSELEKKSAYDNVLNAYSEQCKALYLKSELTPGVLEFMQSLKGDIYIASGSEQSELREVFQKRGLDIFFKNIYGSPTPKVELVSNILKENKSLNAIMFGDAISDMNAAFDNNIDFVAYLPYSNVKIELQRESSSKGFPVINSWDSI